MRNMMLPRGYGSITKRDKTYKRCYWARGASVYYIDEETGELKEKRKSLGFFSTRKEALHALEKYHRERNLLSRDDATFAEIYERWWQEKFPTVRESTVYTYEHAFDLCGALHKRLISELRLSDLQEIIDKSNKNYPTLKTMKILMIQVFNYAVKYDLVLKNYATYVDIGRYKNKNPNKMERDKFSHEQVKSLWNTVECKYDYISLMLLYTGVRISELLNLEKVNVHLYEQYFFVKESKTDNGIRKVPIHDKILPFFEEWYNSSPEDYKYLLYDKEFTKLTYIEYVRKYYKPLMTKLDITLTPHCCRHTCISMMSEKGVDPTYIKLIVGHSGAMSLTERVYIHIDIQDLVLAINKI